MAILKMFKVSTSENLPKRQYSSDTNYDKLLKNISYTGLPNMCL
jgi:hypothetical protein